MPIVWPFWFYYRGDELLAVDAMTIGGFMIGRRLIEAGQIPAPALIEDPATEQLKEAAENLRIIAVATRGTQLLM